MKNHNLTGLFLKRLGLFLLLCLFLTSCSFGLSPENQADDYARQNETLTGIQSDFDDFLMEEFCASFENDLLNLHYTLKNPENYGIETPEKAFSPITEEYNEECIENMERLKEDLGAFDQEQLTEKQQILYDTLEKYLTQQIALSDYMQFLHVLGPDSGISSNLPLTLAEYAFYREEDVKDYLSMLPQIPSLFEEAFAWEENQATDGYSLSDFEIEDTIKQIETFLGTSDSSEANLLIETFDQRIDDMEALSEDQKSTYKANNRELINNIVLPAYELLKTNLSELAKTASSGKGLSTYKNGAEYYELLIQSMTMSDRSIDALIKAMKKRMQTLTSRIMQTSIGNEDAYEIFYNIDTFTDETPKQMLVRLETCIQDAYPALSGISYKIEPISSALENNATAAYYMIPPFDSAEENRIYYGKRSGNSASLFMTLAHEGYPGHLYQQNYMLNNGLHPLYYVMDITGYKEAWAYYVEIDAADYCDFGTYDEEYHDALTELYRCEDEFSYCISSLIDLYVNGKGYTKEQIGDILEEYGLDSTSAKAFYEYAIEEPGAYLQYYVGYLELLTIRQDAEKALGNDFNKKQFHTKLLEIGPCYFQKLAEIMEE